MLGNTISGATLPGRLRIVLVRAENLMASDLNGKSDPYVKFQFGGFEQASSVVHKNLDPVWNETLEFAGVSKNQMLKHGLKLEVWDKDYYSKHDPLGNATTDLAELDTHSRHEYELKLADPFKGSVFIDVTWLPDQLPRAGPGRLCVLIKHAVELRSADHLNGKADPYVLVRCGGEERRSSVRPHKLAPVWNEPVEFEGLREDLVRRGLTLMVMDKDHYNANDTLGEVSVNLWEKLKESNSHGYDMPLLHRGKPKGKILFSVSWEPSEGHMRSRMDSLLHVAE
uniref:C2 domain-containing protein n=1 Tax=Haptolina brevifila TaxID=156173 RepID=A0A7S2N2U2_9EUKA